MVEEESGGVIEPVDWHDLKELVSQLSGMSPPDREQRLGELSARTRAEVESLLAHEDNARLDRLRLESLPDLPTVKLQDHQATQHLSAPGKPSALIGRYQLFERLGQGGMGVVYRAYDPAARRWVAIKLIHPGLDPQQFLARFDLEKNALSALSHPSIARVFDAGVSEDGDPYIVIEFVDGPDLATYCDDRRLSIHQRLRLFQRICSAVQHAHSKGIVHRDLKPDNILIATVDEEPMPKIIDFGLAKALHAPLTDLTVASRSQNVMGTIDYMSPEQASGQYVDTKADVYALGVVLYELLVGKRPHDFRERSHTEAVLIVQEREAPRASQRLGALNCEEASNIARLRNISLDALTSLLPGELDWIALQALERDRERRYETPLDLAQDIDRFIVGREPILARPPSTLYRLKKLTTRHWIPIAIAVAAMLLLIGFTTWTRFQRDQLARQNVELLGLSDSKRLQDLIDESKQLWPVTPEKRQAYQSWLDRSSALMDRLFEHERTLHEMATAAIRRDGSIRFEREDGFRDDERQWQYEIRKSLIHDLHQFATADRYGDGIESVRWRLHEITRIDRDSRSSKEAQSRWERCQLSLRENPIPYQQFELAPQWGLLPLGRNERTQLLEFADLRTGVEPRPNPDWVPDSALQEEERHFSRWLLTKDTAVILVLVPPGRSWIGVDRPSLGVSLNLENSRITRVSQHCYPKDFGIQVDDRLLSVNGHELASGSESAELESNQMRSCPTKSVGFEQEIRTRKQRWVEIESEIAQLRPGATIQIVYERDGEIREASVTLPDAACDSLAKLTESPSRLVDVEPYLISKYELTQGQWLHMTGENPSRRQAEGTPWGGNPILFSNPVESVSWNQCSKNLARFGLALPTVKEWEAAARAGTRTPWWCGRDKSSIGTSKAGNVADAWTRERDPGLHWRFEQWSDGAGYHAPVGLFRSNPYGLHDTIGNVAEWCAGFARSSGETTATLYPDLRVTRGGAYSYSAAGARVTSLGSFAPDYLFKEHGVRAARPIEP